MSNLQFANYPGTEAQSESIHYSQAVKVGNIVKTSGQGGWDVHGNISSNVDAQVAAALDNVENALRSIDSRLSWDNVYAVRSYHVNIDETFEVMSNIFKKRLSHRPIWTCVQIGKLGIEAMLVEIEVEAFSPN